MLRNNTTKTDPKIKMVPTKATRFRTTWVLSLPNRNSPINSNRPAAPPRVLVITSVISEAPMANTYCKTS